MDEIDVERITKLRLKHTPWKDIADILSVSRFHLLRWKKKHDFVEPLRTPSDAELEDAVVKLCSTNSLIGEKYLLGHLRGAHKFVVKRDRLRTLIQRLWPEGRQNRKYGRLKRKVYNAFRPWYIVHFDGYEKLVNWGIYITGGIDGYSRTITFLQANDNKRAGTVLRAAMDMHFAVHGVPEMSRCDFGKENVGIMNFMTLVRGDGRALEGVSTHNQRIERLWRDLFEKVIWPYHELFCTWTLQGMNMSGMNAKYVLHHLFMPRINAELLRFKVAWNHHIIARVGRSPEQLLDALPHRALRVDEHVMAHYRNVMDHLQTNYDNRGIRSICLER